MVRNRHFYLFTLLLYCILFCSCIYDYDPQNDNLQGLDKPLVVVDGDILVGDITQVNISFTNKLSGDDSVGVPSGITVLVESETGEAYSGFPVNEEADLFEIDTRDLKLDSRYRLIVSIPGRGEYISSFKSVAVSPPIDKITYSFSDDGTYANIEVTTYNEDRDILYCKWNYTENWESPAVKKPTVEYIPYGVNEGFRELTYEERMERSYCWSEYASTDICIANTEKLSQNIISKFILRRIPRTDTRVMGLYSVNVRQKALDREAFIYWHTLQRNLGGTGGIFSAQPVDLRGNITSVTDTTEIAIGYINVTTVSEKRQFINWEEYDFYESGCISLQFEAFDLMKIKYSEGYRVYSMGDGTPWWSLQRCVDCRSYSNSTRPDFWPR